LRNEATFGDTTQLEWKRLVPPGAEPDAAALSSPKAGKTEAGLNAKPRWLSRRHQINLPPTGHHYRAPERKAIIVPPIFCRVCKRGKEAGELHAPCACLDRYRYAHAHCIAASMAGREWPWRCPFCLQHWRGETGVAVARQQLAEVKHEPEDSEDRMHAEVEAASALLAVGDLSSRLVLSQVSATAHALADDGDDVSSQLLRRQVAVDCDATLSATKPAAVRRPWWRVEMPGDCVVHAQVGGDDEDGYQDYFGSQPWEKRMTDLCGDQLQLDLSSVPDHLKEFAH
jgi:hypothetical protein